jgi:hypothetical protein
MQLTPAAPWDRSHLSGKGEASASTEVQRRDWRGDSWAGKPCLSLATGAEHYVIVGQPFTEVQQGIAFPQKGKLACGRRRKGVHEMLEDGGYQPVLAKWRLESNAVAGLMIDGEPVK